MSTAKDANQNLKESLENINNKIENIQIKDDTTVFLVVGMAGTGKTSFCQRLYSWISSNECDIDKNSGLNSCIFSINLDPAVLNTKMPLNVDIRDHIDFLDVMSKYNIGPNGAITTCLNLFLLDIDKHINSFMNLTKKPKYIIIDTPGQIETFTWSSPGYIIRDYFKSVGNLVMVYLVDSHISHDPSVFMSNMMYSISLMSRYEVPVLCTFNKVDLEDASKIEEWIRDYESFRKSLNESNNIPVHIGSLALYFEEFYNSIDTVSVSSKTGYGKDDFFNKIREMVNGNK